MTLSMPLSRALTRWSWPAGRGAGRGTGRGSAQGLLSLGAGSLSWGNGRRGQVVRQRSAKPRSAVRFRSSPRLGTGGEGSPWKILAPEALPVSEESSGEGALAGALGVVLGPTGLGGGTGRRKGLKIPRRMTSCGFDSRPRHSNEAGRGGSHFRSLSMTPQALLRCAAFGALGVGVSGPCASWVTSESVGGFFVDFLWIFWVAP